jgi:hypothetical protein
VFSRPLRLVLYHRRLRRSCGRLRRQRPRRAVHDVHRECVCLFVSVYAWPLICTRPRVYSIRSRYVALVFHACCKVLCPASGKSWPCVVTCPAMACCCPCRPVPLHVWLSAGQGEWVANVAASDSHGISGPCDVVQVSRGYLVVDHGNDRLVLAPSDGGLALRLGQKGTGQGQLLMPAAISVVPVPGAGTLLLVREAHRRGRITVFSPMDDAALPGHPPPAAPAALGDTESGGTVTVAAADEAGGACSAASMGSSMSTLGDCGGLAAPPHLRGRRCGRGGRARAVGVCVRRGGCVRLGRRRGP